MESSRTYECQSFLPPNTRGRDVFANQQQLCVTASLPAVCCPGDVAGEGAADVKLGVWKGGSPMHTCSLSVRE